MRMIDVIKLISAHVVNLHVVVHGYAFDYYQKQQTDISNTLP